jgi:Flp pilus assembly protein TadG
MIAVTRHLTRRRNAPARAGSAAAARPRRDDGAAAVEFALVSTLVFLLLFGLINFGIIFSQQLTLNNGIREGARKAVVNEVNPNRTCQGILNATRNELSGLAMTPGTVKFKISTSGFTSTEPCAAGAPVDAQGFSATVTSGTAANVPCKGSFVTTSTSGTAGSLVIEARYTTSALIGFPPFSNSFTVQSKAVYRCEFTA